MNRVTVHVGAYINNKLSCQVAVDPMLQFRNLDFQSLYGYVVLLAVAYHLDKNGITLVTSSSPVVRQCGLSFPLT